MTTNSPFDLTTLKSNVQEKFVELRAALHMREKLLLRQLDVIAQQHTNAIPATSTVQFIAEQEELLLNVIRSYGRFQLNGLILQDVYLRNEDYITPHNDHEIMYKCLDAEQQQSETIMVNFAQNKSLIEHNRQQLNDSIINITLQEAKELICRAKFQHESFVPPLNLEELNDEIESSLADAMSSLTKDKLPPTRSARGGHVSPAAAFSAKKKKSCKPKITINNCNGTINLRNIARLTINCTSEQANTYAKLYKLQQHQKMQQTSQSLTTTTSNSKDESESEEKPEEVQIDDEEEAEAEEEDDDDVAKCVFYNRLLNEIKQSLKQNCKKNDNTHYLVKNNNLAAAHELQANVASTCTTTTGTTNSQQEATISSYDASVSQTAEASNNNTQNRRFVLKNFENLKIILEANSDEETFHPVQIEQWLAEIIAEGDLEPVASTDILEHSKIDST